jgi:hypothetical protein
MTRLLAILFITLAVFVSPGYAYPLILGGAGNKPISDPGWPKGAAAIFNHPGRIAWWEGPPFGGGQWHSECRGDAKTLSAILADVAKLDVPTKRVVVHDGAGHSFWLAPNNEPQKLDAARIDWVFMVWQSAKWQVIARMPADLKPSDVQDASPPAQIDVYTSNLSWSDVVVPRGIELVDGRLEAHGFTLADGVVLEGQVSDLVTKQPVAASIRLERIEPQKQGGYLYPVVMEAKANAQGRWVLKKVPAGWFRVVVDAPAFVPRVVAYVRLDDQPQWQFSDCGLARPAAVSGRVTDDAGKPLADVEVRLQDVVSEPGGRYESPLGYTFKTDAEGRFLAERVPVGRTTIWVHKPGYCRPGLGLEATTPAEEVALQMLKAARARVTVDFAGKERPTGYIVSIEPEGGEGVGKFGGSGNIDTANRITYENVPPGRYVFRGRPNPSSADEISEPVTVDLKGGETTDVKLKAK